MSTQPLRLSSRSEAVLEKKEREAGSGGRSVIFQRLGDQYSADNPAGLVNVGWAENSLMHDWLTSFFEANLKLTHTDFTYGASLVGSPSLCSALIDYYTTYFKPVKKLSPNEIVVSGGVTVLLDTVASALCDPGDSFIVPAPFYAAFPDDFAVRSDVKTLSVEIPEDAHGSPKEVDALEEEMIRRRNDGTAARVRGVVVTNPNNPLGFCYSREALLAYCEFAERWNLFLIVDEVYATSIYSSDASDVQPFISILSLNVSCHRGRIIQLYGISKDFGSNGLRVGVLVVPENQRLLDAMAPSSLQRKIGSPSGALWAALLASPLLPTYLRMNQERLAEAYSFLISWLRLHNIPYRPSYAGLFVVIDLRQFLLETSPAGEEALQAKLVEAGVFLGAGLTFHMSTPGFYRVTFSVARDLLGVALERMEQVLKLPKGQKSA